MNDYTLYDSIVSEELLKEFPSHEEWNSGFDFMDHMQQCGSLDAVLSLIHTLEPRFVEIGGYVFVEDLLNRYGDRNDTYADKVKSLEQHFKGDRKKIEQAVNSWSIGDFFINCKDKSFDNEKLFNSFAKALRYFWQRRVNELFPDRKVTVELGQEIMGELGLTITVYQS